MKLFNIFVHNMLNQKETTSHSLMITEAEEKIDMIYLTNIFREAMIKH